MATGDNQYGLENRAKNLFGIDLNVPSNHSVTGGLSVNIGSTTLAVLSLLVIGSLFLTFGRK